MLTLQKINNRNKSNKCNYQWLVYEHNHEIISCEHLGNKLSPSRMGIHNALPDTWNDKEIKWNVSGYNDIKICRLKFNILDKIIHIIIDAECDKFYTKEGEKLKFYLIDNNGKKITKSLIL